MNFGLVPTTKARGHRLAHSLNHSRCRLAKGHLLTQEDVNELQSLGIYEVTVAQLSNADIEENTAAKTLALPLACANIRQTDPFSGRVNLVAKKGGILRVKAQNITAFNAIDEAITIATLPDYSRVHEGSLLATIKIIPYAVDKHRVAQACKTLSKATLSLHPLTLKTADLILTKTPNFKLSLLSKGETAVRTRMSTLDLQLKTVQTVPHTQGAVAAALKKTSADITLILGASATSDRADVAPAALIEAGGTLTRFGMPVDPGNLLFLGQRVKKPVIGLPGCARSPALNGVDWVLERLCAGLNVSSADIAAMGVGGLLKEIPARPQPRQSAVKPKGKPHVLLLAAGKSSRMQGENKLLRKIDGEPLVVRIAKRLSAAKVGGLTIVVNPESKNISDAIEGLCDQIVVAADANTGLAASLRAGINALPASATAVIVALADMPEVTSNDINALIRAFATSDGALIVAPTAPNGKRGNPVLFDRCYFEPLASLKGDTGAKNLIDSEIANLHLIPRSEGVLIDLDTPEAWDAWEKSR